MTKHLLFLFFLFTIVTAQAQKINIIPQPVRMKVNAGDFILDKNTCILAYLEHHIAIAGVFNEFLKNYYGFTLPVKKKTGKNEKLILFTSVHAESNYPNEGYGISVQTNKIEISAKTRAGWFYAIQTLFQLLPTENLFPKAFGTKIQNLRIPQLTITDYPRFAYRGMHLDVSRHFFPVSYVKKYIDWLALHKMNYFHWHLTEDQGWRIEIKKYPNLIKTGAWRNGTIMGRYPGKGSDETVYGGFYTQEEIKEVVKYAADRYITVVPEIELPGHSSAAIASYPFLSCFPNEPTKIPANMISKRSVNEQSQGRIKLVQETWGVFEDVFCAGKDSTFIFLQNVLDEVMALFPSNYIHVGGDECPKENWKRCPNCQQRIKAEKLKDEHELQSYFIQRMEKYLNSKGRTLIGWDEILEGGLAPKAVVMSWRGEKGGIEAAKQDHYVIMTPETPLYLNHSQTRNEDSITQGGFNSLEMVYNYDPVPTELNEKEGKYILGAQGNLWSEYIGTAAKLEYSIFPRMTALSEVLWSKKEDRSWPGFEKRLKEQFKRYELWGTNYSRAYFELRATVIPAKDLNGVLWKVESKNPNEKIQYNKVLTADDPHNPPAFYYYTAPVKILKSGVYQTWSTESGKRLGNTISQKFYLNKATGKKITLANEASKNYPGDGAFTLVNGVINEKGLQRSTEFLGFLGTDCEAIIDLGEIIPVSFVGVNCFSQIPSWIWQPRSAEVFGSADGENFFSLKQSDVFTPKEKGKGIIMLSFKQTHTRYIKIVVKNWGVIPADNPGAGTKAWLFVDEIEVN
jgi:hexosaminidase